jgi:hypothetical protein
MAGAYGSLNSRADFRRALSEAIEFVEAGKAGPPDDPARKLVEAQLKAMEQWTENGRTPKVEERGQIKLGVIATREYSDTGDVEIEHWVTQLSELYAFIHGWPTDAEAASATPDDTLALLKKSRDNEATSKRWHEAQLKKS